MTDEWDDETTMWTADADAIEASGAGIAFVDASAIVALVDRDDRSHLDMVAAYRSLVEDRYRLFTTDFAAAETYDLLRVRLGAEVARRWLRESTLAVYHVDAADLRRAERMLQRARSDEGLSFTDAVSLVVMRRFNIGDALAADARFLADA